MQRAMIMMMLIFGVFPNVFAKEPEPAEMTEKGDSERCTGSVIQTAAAGARTVSEIMLYGIADLNISFPKSNNLKSSRLGLKGNQDLGAGLKAIFKLESGFSVNNGQLESEKLFHREVYAGLASGLGTVTLGRQYAASDAVAGIADIAVPSSSFSAYKSQFYWNIDRLDKAALYSSPKMGGFQALLGYALGKRAGAAGGSTITTGLLYSAGPLSAGIALESWRTSAFSTSAVDYNFWNLAASYDLGVVALVAGFSSDDINLDISSTTAVKSKTYALGAKLPAGTAGKVVFLSQATKPEHGTAMNITSLGYTHALSKCTALYSQIAVANNPAANVYRRKREFTFGVRYQFKAGLCGN